MRKLANLFLILFVVSAVSGILGAIVPSVAWVGALHRTLWLACLLTGILVYIGFGFNRHLPRSVLIPPLLWLVWSLVSWWPFALADSSWGLVAAYVAQLLLAMISLKINFILNGRDLLLVPEQFSDPGFSLRRLVVFALVSLLVVPATVLLVLFSAAGNLLVTSTGGFVTIRPDGLYMTEKLYQRANKQIRLAGMIHLGQDSYYNDLIASIPAERTVILAEGVSDETGLMQHDFGYGRVADLLGLSPQEHFPFAGRLISRQELDQPYRERFDGPHILPADIDLQQFDPRTVEVLNALARYVLNAESLLSGYLEFNRWVQEHMTVDINRVVMNDLIDKRNHELIGIVPQALNRYDTLVVPWGALHMKGIEAAVIEADFYLVESISRRSINFFDLPLIRVWKQLRADN